MNIFVLYYKAKRSLAIGTSTGVVHMETSVADMESISTTSGTHKNYLKIFNLTDKHAKCLFNWYFNNYCSELRDT